MAKKEITREEWLNNLAKKMAPMFKKHGHKYPKIRISCGFTSSGTRGKVIGETWFAPFSSDATTEIFIKPDQSTPLEVSALLLHELIHAVLGAEAKHGHKFKTLALALGLQGKMTETTGGEIFLEWITPMLEKLGAYPHARLNSSEYGTLKPKQFSGPKKNCRCPECDYFAQIPPEFLTPSAPRIRCPFDSEFLLTKEERSGKRALPLG